MRARLDSDANDGRLCRKRGDTLVSTIDENYDRDFGVRGDMHLGTLLELRGKGSLNNLLRDE